MPHWAHPTQRKPQTHSVKGNVGPAPAVSRQTPYRAPRRTPRHPLPQPGRLSYRLHFCPSDTPPRSRWDWETTSPLAFGHLGGAPGALQGHRRRHTDKARAPRAGARALGRQPPRWERLSRDTNRRARVSTVRRLSPADSVRTRPQSQVCGILRPCLPPTATQWGGEARGPGAEQKSGAIYRECLSLLWRGIGPAGESKTSPHPCLLKKVLGNNLWIPHFGR